MFEGAATKAMFKYFVNTCRFVVIWDNFLWEVSIILFFGNFGYSIKNNKLNYSANILSLLFVIG